MLYNGYTTMQLTKQQAQTYCNTGAPAFPVVDATIDDVHSVRLLAAMSEPANLALPQQSQPDGHKVRCMAVWLHSSTVMPGVPPWLMCCSAGSAGADALGS